MFKINKKGDQMLEENTEELKEEVVTPVEDTPAEEVAEEKAETEEVVAPVEDAPAEEVAEEKTETEEVVAPVEEETVVVGDTSAVVDEL